ncbi:MAG: nucleoside hydrolase [Thermoguttaceae bacterium]
MREKIRLGLAICFFGMIVLALPTLFGAEPVKLIIDTDMGNDVDDALALAVAHALNNRNECELIGVTITKDNPNAAPMVNLLNTFYGRSYLPIGVVRDGVTPDEGGYNRQVAQLMDERSLPAFPRNMDTTTQVPEAVGVLRKLLSEQEDESVVIVQIGFSTNLARLLASGPDALSNLSGKDLVEKKVRCLEIMAGAFDPKYTHVEYNIDLDVQSAKKLIANWPKPIIFNGFEIGDAIQYPAKSIQDDYNYVKIHPIREAYRFYKNGIEQDTAAFDLVSVLHAVRPDRGYVDLSEPGTVVLDEKGYTKFVPGSTGKHRIMKVSPTQIARVREALSNLASEPPRVAY